MLQEYSKEELWKIYNALPPDLQDAVFSEDTAESISNICQICNVENVSLAAKLVGRTLMGLLPPKDFIKTAKGELNLEEERAKQFEMNIQHYIFNPVADDLEFIYESEKKGAKEGAKETSAQSRKDSYRETIKD